jgi:ubiquinone/menaquinone biosynthesis C-methylase UbiE
VAGGLLTGECQLNREYQYGFSSRGNAMYDVTRRERKAQTMVSVLDDFCAARLQDLRVLNVGGSTGIIDNYLAGYCGSVTGVDIDEDAIAYARENYRKDNLTFDVGDALNLQFPDNSFDVVICSQVYEHVPDAHSMMDEIFRVLVPGGVCYFAANNRLMWNEPHYNLPLLSVMPRPLANIYMRMAGKAEHYHELHYTYWGLRKLVRRFHVHDYTLKLVRDPVKYSIAYMIRPGSAKASLAGFMARYVKWLSPGYIWLLEKPAV